MIKLIVPQLRAPGVKRCLVENIPGITVEQAERLIRRGDVRLNGQPVKKDMPAQSGDILDIYLDEDSMDYRPEPEIIYEDDNLIIFNKPQGMACISDREEDNTTLYAYAVDYMIDHGQYDVDALCVPYLCHRIDQYAGGLVMVAKNEMMFHKIFEAIRQRRVRKFCRAIVVGEPAANAGELHDFVIAEANRPKVKVLDAPARNALPMVTRYQVLKKAQGLSLLELELVTARTHQAISQLAKAGMPVLGDNLYGNKKANKKYAVKYQALFASRILFETGTHNSLEYLDKKQVELQDYQFPEVGLL